MGASISLSLTHPSPLPSTHPTHHLSPLSYLLLLPLLPGRWLLRAVRAAGYKTEKRRDSEWEAAGTEETRTVNLRLTENLDELRPTRLWNSGHLDVGGNLACKGCASRSLWSRRWGWESCRHREFYVLRTDRRTQREDWDAGPPRAPFLAVRRELRVAARRSGLAAQVSRSAHPVREGAAALQRPVR